MLTKTATPLPPALIRPAWSIQGSVGLQASELLRIRDGRNLVIAVDEGGVWITQEGDHRDLALETGDRFRLERDGTSLVNALQYSELTLYLPLPDRGAPRVDVVRGRASGFRLNLGTFTPTVFRATRSMPKLNPHDLRNIADRTLEHYNRSAEDFWEGTRNHDVSQNIRALLQYIEGEPPFTILDLGCGPGRDLKAIVELGHLAVGLEGAARFAAMAQAHSGCEVWQQDFLKLELPDHHFDGVFANAALFHVPSQELPRVLLELHTTLKPRGVMFASNPHGHNEEGWNRGRYGAYHDLETWRRYMSAAGFVELTHYYRPAGVPREQQPWLASVWRRGSGATTSRPQNGRYINSSIKFP